MLFNDKESFKTEFIERLNNKYGRCVEDSNDFERYDILGEMVRDYAGKNARNTHDIVTKKNEKQLIYFSMEFLIGRLLINNIQNLGIYQIVKDGLKDLKINLHDLEEKEADAGLGNGGLGRLAACFLDSIASLGYPGHGNCLRFEYGFFRQKLDKGYQKELPDQWLTNGYVFEVRKPKYAVTVNFYGYSETYIKPNGNFAMRTSGSIPVLAMPYDVSVVGYRNNVANTLRLWSAEPSSELLPDGVNFNQYLNEVKQICNNLYPDDSNEEGRLLRIKQEYFLVSAGLQSVINSHLKHHKNLDNLNKSYIFHLNDTHPILAIPELMRLLMDVYDYGWDKAWGIVTSCIAYTNHTVLPEALEKWPVNYIQRLIPRCFTIIEEIHRRFMIELNNLGVDNQVKYNLSIIKDGHVHMANLGCYASISVNGVAKIHSDILKAITFKDFYRLYPYKFNNKTNGVTHRRWLLNANPELANLITSKITDKWILDPLKLEDFRKFDKDKKVLDAFLKIKHDNKIAFKDFVKEAYNIDIDANSIYDVQIKRLHAYKRQLLNLLHIIYQYYEIKDNPSKVTLVPHTYIFGAKSAPSYYFAKKVIELILAVAKVVNNDPVVSKYIKIVFVENYGVTLAEKIIPAADVSEQISTAGYEASGTSNMKLMMNGAVTLGTLDGANIEIAELAKEGNNVIFGLKADEVEKIKAEGKYNPFDVYNKDEKLHRVIDSLFNGPWAINPNQFRPVFDEIMNKRDEYLVFKDFYAYVEAHKKIDELYKDKEKWAKMCINNIAGSGTFSSDRTIEEYNKDIWHLNKISKAK